MKMKKRAWLFAGLLALQFTVSYSQVVAVTVSGAVITNPEALPLPYANIVLKNIVDSSFVAGTVTAEDGRFSITAIHPGDYFIEVSLIGYHMNRQPLFVGGLSEFLEIKPVELERMLTDLGEVVITSKEDEINGKMDKKVYTIGDNISQGGGSVLQTMQNLPGVSVQDGKVQLRGNDRITVLIDGKQTALTGFGNQSGLDNIPASSIEKIEIINNPSSKYDANGNAGIINIILKKNDQNGFSGKVGISAGAGALWIRHDNLPTIRPQYQFTPKVNPSIAFNYRRKKINFFLQADNLYTHTLNKNEFVTRVYDDGTIIRQQTKRNRMTNFFTSKAGVDWHINDMNTLTISGLFGSEKILDNGDEPFFNEYLTERKRLWQFLEDEIKTTAMVTASYIYRFRQPGHSLGVSTSYTFHQEDEQYYFDNIMPTFTGRDTFKLISDEHVADLNIDYIRPLKYGRIEAGGKFRYRAIPTDMLFIPGLNSPLDSNAGGWATYKETIPAVYANYVFENKRFEAEAGVRIEYVGIQYDVNPDHNTYTSNGYDYTQPFPTVRFAYKINDRNKISFFYNRRVDRPNEVDIRIFPKYDDAEIIKVGNPGLRPQFTNSFELGYKTTWKSGYFYSAAYFRFTDGTITRISTTAPGSPIIYAVFQNAGRSYNTGLEVSISWNVVKWYSFNINANAYYNQIDAFTVENLYPAPTTFSAAQQQLFSGNIKLNNLFHLPKGCDIQLTAIYLAPDIIPQGKIDQRFSLDLGVKKTIQKGLGELFLNATDILNTLVIRKEVQGNGFRYTSSDYYETQVVRVGYSYKFVGRKRNAN